MGTNDLEELALWRLGVLTDRILEIYERGKNPFPVPSGKSRLAEVDAQLGAFPVTHAVERLIAVSSDNLHAVAMLVRKAEALHLYAPYAVIRASLETSGTAMWLLSGGSKSNIALHALRLEWENKKNRDAATAKPVREKGEWALRRERLLLEAGSRFGLSPKAIKVRPLSSVAVADGSAHFGLAPMMLSAWKGSSGAAHGRTWAALALSNHDIIPGTESDSGASYLSTVNTPTLVSFLLVAVAAHEVLETGYTAMLEGRTKDFRKDTSQKALDVYAACRLREEGL